MKLFLIVALSAFILSEVFGNEIDWKNVKSGSAFREIPLLKPLTKLKPSRVQLTSRINGGSMVPEITYFPYQAGFLTKRIDNITMWCGGAIISKNFILTAAHCCEDITNGTLYLGTVNRINPEPSAILIPFSINDVTMHEKYDPEFYHNDIALIRVDPFQFSESIKPIELISQTEARDNRIDGKSAAVSGWGHTSDSEINLAENLHFTLVKPVTKSKCKDKINNYRYLMNNEVDDMICIEDPAKAGSCRGDSGGPVVSSIHNIKKLIGIVSHDIGARGSLYCGKPMVGVYTRVSSYAEWICKISKVCS